MPDFKLPEIGENIKSAKIAKIEIKVGDVVKKDQALFEIESDKASLTVPASFAGKIVELLVTEGQDVKVGSVVIKYEVTSEEKKEVGSKKPEEKATHDLPTSPSPLPSSSPSTLPTSHNKSVTVIGGGPGGYAAAFYAADLGMEVTLIDLDINPGGVCLYRGCIPSKALLHAAKILNEAKEAKTLGIDFASPKVDLNKLRDWKNKVVTQLTGGLGQMNKLRKVNYIQGRAVFTSSSSLEITKSDGSKIEHKFEKAILATGSYPIRLPTAPESPHIMDSTSALDLPSVPERMLVIGGGYIGLELGTVYAALGSKVSVVEMTQTLLAGCDRDLANILIKRLEHTFDKIMISTKVTKMEADANGVHVSFEDKDGKSFVEQFGKVLVAIGRRPNSQGLGLEKTKVQLDEKGFVRINAQRQTHDQHIFAIGDIAGEPMLAHKASHEGRVAVEAILGHKVAFEPKAIPAVVFTDPEIAWCGLTETQAAKEGRNIAVAKFPWGASGRAITLDRVDGVTKLIIDPETERVLGMAIAGVGAGELIAEGVLAIEMGALATDIKLSIHPHPTTSETLMESAESFFGQATHIFRPKKQS